MSSPDIKDVPRGRRVIGLAGLALLAVLASACTVRPVYMQTPPGSPAMADLSAISVNDAIDRVGQEVRNNLVFAFTGGKPPAPPRYDLAIFVSTSEARLGFEKDETAPAYQVTVSVRFELKEIASNRVILRSTSTGVASYDRSNQNFANVRARIDAENRAAQAVADQLQLRLSIALAKEKPIANPTPPLAPAPVTAPTPRPGEPVAR